VTARALARVLGQAPEPVLERAQVLALVQALERVLATETLSVMGRSARVRCFHNLSSRGRRPRAIPLIAKYVEH
jgi:hypothetical protein